MAEVLGWGVHIKVDTLHSYTIILSKRVNRYAVNPVALVTLAKHRNHRPVLKYPATFGRTTLVHYTAFSPPASLSQVSLLQSTCFSSISSSISPGSVTRTRTSSTTGHHPNCSFVSGCRPADVLHPGRDRVLLLSYYRRPIASLI